MAETGEMSGILGEHGIAHSFAGHPAMSGLFFSERAPTNYRDWKNSDYSFCNDLAMALYDRCILCEPDSREPWFVSKARDDECLSETLTGFEEAVEATLQKSRYAKRRVSTTV